MGHNTLIEKRAPETAETLKTIPGWTLRWGIFFMSFLVIFVIYASVELINFNYYQEINVKKIDSKRILISKIKQIKDVDFNEIEYISIKNHKLKKNKDFQIDKSSKDQIIIKFFSYNFNVKEKKLSIKIYRTKSLCEIIIGDLFN